MKISRRKHPDRLVDPCKHSNVNQMAAGLRPPRSSHGFSFLQLFKHTLSSYTGVQIRDGQLFNYRDNRDYFIGNNRHRVLFID